MVDLAYGYASNRGKKVSIGDKSNHESNSLFQEILLKVLKIY